MYLNNFQINIQYRFKLYPNVIVDDKKNLVQLQYFNLRTKRTVSLKILKYDEKRKAYRIESNWVSKKRLLKLIYKA